MGRTTRHWKLTPAHAWLGIILVLALGLRLAVWHWHTYYPLGGDEQEYLTQALTLLREHRYMELRLMRPPLYGIFLAGCIVLVDSLVQHLRLVQALLSTITLIPIWLLTKEIVNLHRSPNQTTQHTRAPLIAALLAGISYTLADYATELLTETLFLFGLSTLLWLLVCASTRKHTLYAALAGVVFGLLCLTRSVALPLLPLGMVWFVLIRKPRIAMLYMACGLLLIIPWTIRNSITYGGLIVVDTTGAENLWLDNDAAGREAVKTHLYVLGDDRVARQQQAMQQGITAIISDPQRFLSKAWHELHTFFALEYADDMLARRAIWVPPIEVWFRLLLGDGIFATILLIGTIGLCKPPLRLVTLVLAIPWGCYTLLTAVVFHVELRYRLPLYPVLLPYAAMVIERSGRVCQTPAERTFANTRGFIPALLLLCLMFIHAPYPVLAWQLGWKHWYLFRAEQALNQRDSLAMRHFANAALEQDPQSVLARVLLAQAQYDACQIGCEPVEKLLRDAITLLPAHPYAHLLLGDILRQRGDADGARRELRYETASLQDLQTWSWQRFTTPLSSTLEIGDGLDLGMITGFHASEAKQHWRWTKGVAQLRLKPLANGNLHLRLASGRPRNVPPLLVNVVIENTLMTQLPVTSHWQDYVVAIPAQMRSRSPDEIIIELRSDTFTPRTYDPASNDGRTLGIMVDRTKMNDAVN